jgi:hypothetical protein
MFFYINEWLKWFNSYSNGLKKDEHDAPEIPFEEPLPTERIEKIEPQPTPDVIPFEEPLPSKKLHGTGWKYN